MAELTPSINPYAYCLNNPINRIDPDGRYSSQFWSDLSRFFHGGNKNGVSYNTGHGDWGYNRIDKKDKNATMNFHDGRDHKDVQKTQNSSSSSSNYTQLYGEHLFGTGHSQEIILPISKYQGPSIDMKEASNDAIDLWASIFMNFGSNADSNPTTNNASTNESVDEETDEDVEIFYEVELGWKKDNDFYSHAITKVHRDTIPKDSVKNRIRKVNSIKGVYKGTIRVSKLENQ